MAETKTSVHKFEHTRKTDTKSMSLVKTLFDAAEKNVLTAKQKEGNDGDWVLVKETRTKTHSYKEQEKGKSQKAKEVFELIASLTLVLTYEKDKKTGGQSKNDKDDEEKFASPEDEFSEEDMLQHERQHEQEEALEYLLDVVMDAIPEAVIHQGVTHASLSESATDGFTLAQPSSSDYSFAFLAAHALHPADATLHAHATTFVQAQNNNYALPSADRAFAGIAANLLQDPQAISELNETMTALFSAPIPQQEAVMHNEPQHALNAAQDTTPDAVPFISGNVLFATFKINAQEMEYVHAPAQEQIEKVREALPEYGTQPHQTGMKNPFLAYTPNMNDPAFGGSGLPSGETHS